MGLAASQARLLLLTARKSDLEYRAQCITNAMMVLAMQSEAAATKYSNALSNTAIFHTTTETNETESITSAYFNNDSNYKLQELNDGVYTDVVSTNGENDEDGENNEKTKNVNALDLAEGLASGRYRIVNKADNTVVSLSGSTYFNESYYTDDDAAAEAVYKAETSKIQVKEKRLQMELQQIESQQKACDSEIDSVKQVRNKNIEKSFKVFS